MKKYLLGLTMLLLISLGAGAQRISLTETAKAVKTLEQSNDALQAQNAELETQLITVEDRLNTIAANVDSLYQAGKKDLKVPITVEDAKSLWGFLAGIVVWLFTGVLSKYRPEWLSDFILSLMVAGVVTAIAYFGSNGEFTFGEVVEFFIFASGGSNIIHQMKKPPKNEPETAAPTPVPA